MNVPQPLSEAGLAALSIARGGWPVFPCDHHLDLPGEKRCKRPLTSHGLKDATTDPIKIETWWRQSPSALIGVPTGPQIGAWVLDPDLDLEKGLDGPAALARFEAEHGPLPDTVESRTPRGGRHLLFKWDAARPITNGSGQLPKGIDVRGAGGFVILPPSMREDGAHYKWENPLDFFEPVEAPGWLYELILAKRERNAGGPHFRSQAGATREEAYARAALDGCAADASGATEGKRNDILNAVAYRLGRMIARGWLSRAEVELRLLAAAHGSGLVADDGEQAAWRTIRSGIEGGLEHPHEDLKDRERDRSEDHDEADGEGSGLETDEPRPPAFTDEALALRFAERLASSAPTKRSRGGNGRKAASRR